MVFLGQTTEVCARGHQMFLDLLLFHHHVLLLGVKDYFWIGLIGTVTHGKGDCNTVVTLRSRAIPPAPGAGSLPCRQGRSRTVEVATEMATGVPIRITVIERL